ncbi:hypothetical protein [Ancylobacter terrae]|uniref:hypothetical protein n=1 Tax=Ancylobacter sp. sgz301288 TaxID=3342077 RepID=UPI0038593B13
MLALGGAASAAEPVSLVGVQGAVLVNNGQGFKTVTKPLALQAGDRVLVRQGGVAAVDYGAGCRMQLNTGVPVTIAATSPCVKTTAADLPVKAAPAPAVQPTVGGIGWAEFLAGLALGGLAGYFIADDGNTYYYTCVTGVCDTVL